MLLKPAPLSVHLGRTEKLTQIGTAIEKQTVLAFEPTVQSLEGGEGEGLKHIYPMVRHGSTMAIFTSHLVLTHG